MNIKYELVVVGGGPAGITLAKRLGNKYKMAIIRPEDYSMIYCAMPYVVEDLIEKKKCLKNDNLITGAGVDLIRDEVVSIDFNNKNLLLKSSGELFYDKIVIASGAVPFIPQIEGVNLEGVMGFKTQKDLEKITSFVQNGLKKAVVIGAGAIGIELAQALKHKGLDVSLVDLAQQVLPNLVGNEFAQRASEELIKNDIHLILNSKVEKLVGKNYVKEVHLDSGEIIYLDEFAPCTGNDNTTIKGLVIFATGVVPDLKFIPYNSISVGRQGIIINERMETSIPDVYAVGDCVQYNSLITGNVLGGKLATNAVPMARILADNLLGRKSEYKGFVNGAATKVYENYVGGTGLTVLAAEREGFEVVKAYSQLTTQFPIMPGKKELRLKLVADKKTSKIIGGQVFSGEPVTGIVDLISFAIQKEATAYDLLDLSYSAQPYQSFFPAGNIVVTAAEQIINQLEGIQN
ncbi:MAG: FAD-dependent oxidoreductase [Marinilabiliaceae bacterium]|nr:FAD-dependent oxidoreductase [Marinilabiliaceae bacterium]